jgi:ribosome-binding ATPase YchF (GTP1/OBG family)
VGEDEVKAWTIRKNTPALFAAGKVHSDIERGFIRAEIISYEAFISAGSMHAAKENGLLRLEGKTYEVKDGDIINFRFNV